MGQVMKQQREVVRPLKVLVSLIKTELEAVGRAERDAEVAAEAKILHYHQLGEMLVEAKEQVQRGEWQEWLKHNFHLSQDSAQIYMKMARTKTDGVSFANMEEFRQSINPNRFHGPAWTQPIKKVIEDPALIERIRQDTQNKMAEAKVTHELALKLIDLGYKVLASKLHPDKGGSKDAMARLNRVREQLKKAVKHIGIH